MSSNPHIPEDDVPTTPTPEHHPHEPPRSSPGLMTAIIYVSIINFIALLGIFLVLQAMSPDSEPPTDEIVTGGTNQVANLALPSAAAASGPIVLAQGGVGTCDPNTGHLNIANVDDAVSGDTERSYPAFTTENPTSVAISYTLDSTDATAIFGASPYAPGTPWNPTDNGAIVYTGTASIATKTIEFAGPVYGLKFVVGALNNISEEIEIRLYDISGTLIPTGSIQSLPQSSFVANDTINAFYYGTAVGPLGEGPGGGYLYESLTNTGVLSDFTSIYVQMSGQTGVVRAEVVYSSTGSYDLYVTAPFFNLACLEKAFDPSLILSGTQSVLNLTVLNSSQLPARDDIGFTDILTPGIVLSGTPSSPQCGATVDGVSGSSVLTVTGVTFALGESSCTISATVATTATGILINDSSNITQTINLDPSGALAQLEARATLLVGDPITGTYGYSYTFFLTPLGFTFPPTLTVVSGSLPPGLTLISTTGEISGTPTAAGIYPSITVSAANGTDPDATHTFTMTIDPAPATIRALDLIVTRGIAFPTPSAVVSGLRLTDTEEIFAPIVVTILADPFSGVGSYPITVTSGTNPNYIITYIPGTLTIRANTGAEGRSPVCYPAVYGPKYRKHCLHEQKSDKHHYKSDKHSYKKSMGKRMY